MYIFSPSPQQYVHVRPARLVPAAMASKRTSESRSQKITASCWALAASLLQALTILRSVCECGQDRKGGREGGMEGEAKKSGKRGGG